MANIFKRHSVKALILFLLLVSGSTYGFCGERKDEGSISLSLRDAVVMAFKNNKDILFQENEIKVAQANIRGAQSAFLPKANLNAGYTHRGTVLNLASPSTKKDKGVFLGYENENSIGVGVEQPIYQGGKNIANLKQAELSLKTQKESLRAKKLSVEFEAKRLFYGLLLAFETERITKQLVDQAQSHYEDVKSKYKEGTASKFDLLQSKVQVSKLSPQLVRAKNAKELIASELKKLLGMKMDEAIELKGTLEYFPFEINEGEFLQQAYLDRPELIMKGLGIDISKQQIEVARSGSRPQISAGLNYDYKSNDVGDMLNSRHGNWNAGVQVSIPLFDGFAAKAKVDEARVRYAQAKLEKEDLSEQIALEIRRSCLDLTQAESIIGSQKDSIEEAKEALKISEVSFENGVGTNLDVLDSQVSLSQIEKNLSEAIYDHVMARAYLDRSRGKSYLAEEKNEEK